MQHRLRVRLGRVAAVAVALLLTGCTAITGPRPGPDAPLNDPAVVAIQSAGDLGALCVLITTEGSPEDVEKALVAVAAAQAVLMAPAPSFADLSAALELGMPGRYAVVSSLILSRLKARLGQAEVIPDDTVAWAMAEEFVTTCGQALGQTATLHWINDTLDRLPG